MDRGEVERQNPEGVGEMDAEGRAANGEMHDLAERGVVEESGWDGVLRLGRLLRGGPGADPV